MLPYSFLFWISKKLPAWASGMNVTNFYGCFPWLLRQQQNAMGIHWHRSPYCLASAEWPQPRSQHPCSSPAFGTAALACGNWKGKLQTTQREKGQCHAQPSHLGNQVCAELCRSLYGLHSKCCKTNLWNFLFPQVLLLLHCNPTPFHCLSVSALLQGPASTLLTDGWDEGFRAVADEQQEARYLLQVL